MNPRMIVALTGKFLTDNAPTILTGAGIAGTVATAVLAGKASWSAANELASINDAVADSEEAALVWTTKKKVLTIAPLYAPPVIVGSGTVAAIFFAHHINAQRLAAAAALYALSDGKLKDYKSKVEELMGVEKKQEVETAVAKDKVKDQPNTLMVVGVEKGLYYDSYSARHFYSTINEIEAAKNRVNLQVVNHGHCSLNEWFREIGLEETGYGENVGWSQQQPFELQIRPAMSDKDIPMAYVDYDTEPIGRYNHL